MHLSQEDEYTCIFYDFQKKAFLTPVSIGWCSTVHVNFEVNVDVGVDVGVNIYCLT